MRKGKKLSDIKDNSGSDLDLCWYRNLPNINFKDEGELLIRIVSDIWEVNRHWITTHKNRKNIYQWCTCFDPIEGVKDPNIACACCEANIRDDIQLAMLVLVRNYQDAGDKEVLRVMLIPKHQFGRLMKLQIKNRADLNSVKKGCDLGIELGYDKKARQNKWDIDKDDKTPLTAAEKKLITDFKTLDEMIPDFTKDEELIPYYDQAKKFLTMNKYFVRMTKSHVDPENPWISFSPDINGTAWWEFPELVTHEQETFTDTRKRKGGCPQTEEDKAAYDSKKTGKGKRNLKGSSSVSEDMDEAFGEEAPPAGKKKKVVKKKRTTTTIKKKKKKVIDPECIGEYDGSEDCLGCAARKKCRLESEDF